MPSSLPQLRPLRAFLLASSHLPLATAFRDPRHYGFFKRDIRKVEFRATLEESATYKFLPGTLCPVGILLLPTSLTSKEAVRRSIQVARRAAEPKNRGRDARTTPVLGWLKVPTTDCSRQEIESKAAKKSREVSPSRHRLEGGLLFLASLLPCLLASLPRDLHGLR